MCPFSPNHSPRFRKPPYDPTRSVFPSAVLTLADPPAAFPTPRKLKCRRICTPLDPGLHAGLGPAIELLPSLVGSTGPPGAQSPFARVEVLPPAAWRPAPYRRALPLLHRSYGLMRQTKTLPPVSGRPRRWVFAGCCQSLLGDGPSRHYLCNPCVGAWTHTPPCSPGASCSFLPEQATTSPNRTKTFGAPIFPCNAASNGA